ncbi:YbhB/YbcL family Raf kinase inhibitor-like protein [[Mycobacterium] nativiensis]|uniref:YbhB/YbcL family Raf kinase inhibitor-like protein n=1 Tax=[Mycobacterium] nativiensis TaxID=2855503 RepID=A0ABU5XTY4_9MYCO|nr:YbhB/YbcL family Raf kinase inhibitor-like protein [Mycolicibacter sp. MYC340]MEB3031383.1 YbhB/YbcL family Raf kinase inhibitor-like protein [Mycolicibacter sp. MYC340]
MRPAVVLILALLALAGCGGAEVSSRDGQSTGFTVNSSAFAEDAPIPTEYSCNGRNVPPPLRWHNVPSGAQSLALVVDDPDAPAGLYVHWVVSGIPPTDGQIVDGMLPPAAVVSLNSGGKADYLGPCPPAGTGVHHYRFQLYALGTSSALAPRTPVPKSTTTIADNSVAVARTVGVYSG